MTRIHDMIVAPSHATIPGTNPTAPTVPPDFTASVVDGRVIFSWGEPNTLPRGTLYQLWSAPFSLSNPASKSLAWEGDVLGATLDYTVNSPAWFQLSARAGSYFSPYSPSTYGIGVVPAYYAPPAPPAGWSASIAPTNLSKIGSASILTTGAAAVTVVGSAAAVFSWTNPGSANIKINAAGAAMTTFTGSGMANEETRSGAFWCNVVDGANTSSKSVMVSVTRETFA